MRKLEIAFTAELRNWKRRATSWRKSLKKINTPMQYIGDNIELLDEWFGDVFEIVALHEECLNSRETSWDDRRNRVDELYRQKDFEELRHWVAESIGDCRDG